MITDNYSGNIGIQYNPANLADSRFRFNMNFIGFNAHLQNNYIQVESPHSIYKRSEKRRVGKEYRYLGMPYH